LAVRFAEAAADFRFALEAGTYTTWRNREQRTA
jgi:hypothetical protein